MLAHKKLWECGLYQNISWQSDVVTSDEEFELMQDIPSPAGNDEYGMICMFFALYFADEASDPISRMQVNSDYDPEDYIEV